MPHVQSFSSKDEFNKNFGRTSFFLEGGVLKLCEPDVHPFFKASIPPSSRYSIHPFLQIILVQISQFPSPQAAATTYALSSVFILLLCGLHLGGIVVIVLFCCRGSVLVAALAGSLHLPADGLRQHLHQDPLHGLDVHATRPGFCVLFLVLFFTEYIVYNLYTLNNNLRKICWSPAQ